MRREKKSILDNIIDKTLFLYIVSLYIFSFKEDLNLISNLLAALLIITINLEILIEKRKIYINKFLVLYFIFTVFAMLSSIYAIDSSTAIQKTITLILIFILMYSLANYIYKKNNVNKILKYFSFSGVISSIYILLTSDLNNLKRYGEELGNVNAVGMIIGISTLILISDLLFKKKNKYIYIILIILNLTVILMTGSRKAIIFITVCSLFMVLVNAKYSISKKIRTIFLLIISIFSIYKVININEMLYQIIGIRIENLIDYLKGSETTDGSINIRSDMIQYGFKWFLENPLLGYGIDNYRFLYARQLGTFPTYSHNNYIELMVGLGSVGTIIFYSSHVLILVSLFYSLKKYKGSTDKYETLFIGIIICYLILSTSMVYYYEKHISILLLMASMLYDLSKKQENNNENKTPTDS